MLKTKAQTSRYRGLLILLVLLAVSLAVIFHLFTQRFAAGDIYPRYSSLRKDNFGTKILYDSLKEAGFSVERNYSKLNNTGPDTDTLYFLTGMADNLFYPTPNADEQDRLLTFSEQDARLVVTLLPGDSKTKVMETKKGGEQIEQKTEESDTEAECEKKLFELTRERFDVADGEKPSFHASTQGMLGNHPVHIPWYSPDYFVELPPEWQTILTVHGQPVLIERVFEKGSLVVAADTHFLSNEAIWHAHDPFLLAWLLGGKTRILFDEAHHGIREQVSVARLIRDFDLYWVLVALLVPTLLFVVRCARPLLPPVPTSKALKKRTIGQDQFTGLINIIRKHSPENLLQTCVSLWCKTHRDWCRKYPDRTAAIQQIARSSGPGNLIANYKKIVQMIQTQHQNTKPNRTGS